MMRGITSWQYEIIETIGEVAIEEAEKRLCAQCIVKDCPLLPLCSNGSACPYFRCNRPEKKET